MICFYRSSLGLLCHFEKVRGLLVFMYDVTIMGGGIVGLVQALLLAKEPGLRIALVEAKPLRFDWSVSDYDARVYAITPASQQLLEGLDLWSQVLAKRVSPYTRMQVWDGRGGGELTFDQAQLNVSVLGYILEENLLREVLFSQVSKQAQIDFLCPRTFSLLEEQEDSLVLRESPSRSFPSLRSKLLIGADGAHSWVREQAGIALQIHDYQHTALIAQVETEESHQQTARQVFLCDKRFPKGPLAFLPLAAAHQSSIVWSTSREEAEQLLHLEENAFQNLLASAFAFRLGKIRSISKRKIFSLYERQAEKYVKNRLALIGDAAHTLHPLAGQGINLGLADAQFLAEVLHQARQKDRDFASLPTLRRYERARRGDNLIMQAAVKLLKSIFTSENTGLSLVRNQGLIATNHFPLLKNFFAHYAMGTF